MGADGSGTLSAEKDFVLDRTRAARSQSTMGQHTSSADVLTMAPLRVSRIRWG